MKVLLINGSPHEKGCTYTCLLYTSDAADEEDSVDLGGRRTIKKKKSVELADGRHTNTDTNNAKTTAHTTH